MTTIDQRSTTTILPRICAALLLTWTAGCSLTSEESMGVIRSLKLDPWIQIDDLEAIPAVWTEENVTDIRITGECSHEGSSLILTVEDESLSTSFHCDDEGEFDASFDFSSLDDGAYRLTIAYTNKKLAAATLGIPGAFHKITTPPDPLNLETIAAPPAFNPTSDSCTISVLATEQTDSSGAPLEFIYSAGTMAGDTNLLDWTSNGTDVLIEVPCFEEVTGGVVYINLMGQDLAGNTTEVVTLDPIYVDTAPPAFADGATLSLGSDTSTSATTSPSATWPTAVDDVSGIGRYEIALGSTGATQDIHDWVSVGTATSGTFTDLNLTASGTYTFFVRAIDGAGTPSSNVLSASFTVTLPGGGGGGSTSGTTSGGDTTGDTSGGASSGDTSGGASSGDTSGGATSGDTTGGGGGSPAPTLTSVSPSGGLLAGGTALTLIGTGFLDGASVTVGSSACASVSRVSSTEITCNTPSAAAAGAVSITVTNSDSQTTTLESAFTYRKPPTQLTFTGSSETALNTCSSAFTITLRDEDGTASAPASSVAVSLSGAGASGAFYSDGACTQAITSLNLGTSASTGTVYVQGTAPASITLSASTTSLGSANLAHAYVVDGLYLVASSDHRVFPSNPLDQGATLSLDIDNATSGTPTDTGTTYSCAFDRLPSGTIVSGSDCTTLPGTGSFNTATGALTWTPNEITTGAYEIVITATTSEHSGKIARTIQVRELYETANLIAHYDAQFFNRSGPPPLITSPFQWSDLTANSQHGSVPESLSTLWGGNGTSVPWHLGFDGSGVVTLPLGTNNSGMTAFSFGMWIQPSAPTALGKVLLGNGGGTGNGFVLRQAESSLSQGKIELQIGSGPAAGTTVDDLQPLHYWRLGEAAGATTVTDQFSTRVGTVQGGVTFGTAGNFADGNTAATFNGSTGNIQLNTVSDLPMGNQPRTICAWARPATTSGTRTIFEYGTRSAGMLTSLGMVNTTLRFSGSSADLSHINFWQANTWKHVCGVYDGTTAYLYGDGALLTSGALSWNTGTTGKVRIGSNINDLEFWNGALDEVGVFDRALSASEISGLYSASVFRRSCRSGTVLASDRWTHVGGSYDGTTLNLLIDGRIECSMPVSSGLASPAASMALGGRADGTSRWSGKVMDLKLYGAGSTTAVTTHYSATRNRAENDTTCFGSRLTNAPFATASAGTAGDPHLICTGTQLLAIDDSSANLSAQYRLARNLDLSDQASSTAPLGTSASPFTGVFDGQYRIVSGLSRISTGNYIGLFGSIGSGGVVRKLLLENVHVMGAQYVGGLSGYALGTVSEVGVRRGAFITSTAAGGVRLGGIIGSLYKPGVVEKSFVDASVSVRAPLGSDAGGIVGVADGTFMSAGNFSTIQNCFSHATVSGLGANFGGIAGSVNSTQVSNNYSAGVVSDTNGSSGEGGVIGYYGVYYSLAGNFYDATVCSSAAGNCASTSPPGIAAMPTPLAQSLKPYVGAGWDFATIWTTPGQATSGQYPVLQWVPGNAAIAPTPTAASTLTYAGGSGTSGSPYLISSLADFDSLMLDTARWASGAYFRLENNIDFQNAELTPIGTAASPFLGNFDGTKKTLSNFRITRQDSNVGLFGYVGNGGVVSNLIVSNATISATYDNAGGIAGYSTGLLSKVGVTGSTTIESTSNGAEAVGGIVGRMYKPSVTEQCFVGASVIVRAPSGGAVGGIAGAADGTFMSAGNFSTIQNCYSHATVSGIGSNFGGIAGSVNSTQVNNNYSAGVVTDTNGSGGEGGIVGSYGAYYSFAGNFYDATVCSSAANNCASPQNSANFPIPTALAKSLIPYVGAGWNFDTIWTTPGQVSTGQYPILQWEAGAAPILPTPTVQNTLVYSGGNGASATPYLIQTVADFETFVMDRTRWSSSANYYALGANLDLLNTLLPPIGDDVNAFQASFDGQSYTLSKINRWAVGNVGLFGRIGATGIVSDLILDQVTVSATGANVGGVAGYSEGTISRVGITGTSSITQNVSIGTVSMGGIVGHMYKPALTEQCFVDSTVTVSSVSNYLGGVVGRMIGTDITAGNFTTVQNCYSRATVSGTASGFGGIAGEAVYGKVLYNYFAGVANDTNGTAEEGGIVGRFSGAGNTFTANYFDNTVCASASSQCSNVQPTGVSGLSTTNMQNSANFTGWDFTNIWGTAASSYHYLRWEP